MSASPIAAFRTGPRDELRKLEEEHLQHDLQQSDRDALRSAATKLSTHATIGSLAGIGLGLFLALRVRNARKLAFRAFQTAEKPTHLQFADGRTGLSFLFLLICFFFFCASLCCGDSDEVRHARDLGILMTRGD